jgi:hypothetical protein
MSGISKRNLCGFKIADCFDNFGDAHILVLIVIEKNKQNTGMVMFGFYMSHGQFNEVVTITGYDKAVLGNCMTENRAIWLAYELRLRYRLYVVTCGYERLNKNLVQQAFINKQF